MSKVGANCFILLLYYFDSLLNGVFLTKKNTFNKASLNKEAFELFLSVKKDIEETEKRVGQKRKRLGEG